jgi:hypothetical protein
MYETQPFELIFMNTQSDTPEKPSQAKKSLLFAIEDIAKLLRTEVKKSDPKSKKRTATRLSGNASPNFFNAMEQIARMLRTQAKGNEPEPKKKRGWSLMKKTPKEKNK